jgi:hypothetical protein
VFAARQRKEFDQLNADWASLKRDAVDALNEISLIQSEIESADPNMLHSEEYRRFKSLLEQKREEADFLNIDAPNDPALIERLREASGDLDKTIGTISGGFPALDEKIKKEG